MPELYNTYDEYVKANPQKGAGQIRMSKTQWENAKKAKGETIPAENNDPYKGYKKATADKLREQADKKDAGEFAGLTASERTANEDRVVADSLDKNNTSNAMEGDSRYAGKPQTEDDTWQNRIKNGKASDDDMKTAYDAWKRGEYTPGPKTLEYFKLHFEGKDLVIPEQKEPEMVTLETVDGMTEKQQQSLWDKLKGKLTNKDLEEYAKENGISYGTALRYTLASFLAGVANDQSIYTGVKPFSDEETQSPLYKRYRVTSGKVDEENATTRAEQKFLKDADTRKEAAEKRGQIEGTNEGAKETSYAFYKTDNGKTFLDLANLNASINDINDEQKLRTMQKELELQNMSQKDLQKFLSALTINQNYAMGKNSIQLEKDKIKMLGDYFAENPKEIDNFVDFMQKNAEGNLTAAQEVNQWIDTVMKPVSALVEAGTEGVTRGAKGGL